MQSEIQLTIHTKWVMFVVHDKNDKARGHCGDGRAVIQPNSFPDTEQVLKARKLSGSERCPIGGLSTVERHIF
jgi:hypothetical protein